MELTVSPWANNVPYVPETEEHWVAVEGGGFEKCTEESAFAVAREAAFSADWTPTWTASGIMARLTLKEVKFVAEYDSCLSYVVERYERWMHVSKKLENIKVAKDSYMASANAIERVDACTPTLTG